MGKFIDTSKRIVKRVLGFDDGGVRQTRVSVLGVPLELVWCPPGTFWMGSPESEEDRDNDEVLHRVTLTKGFWIGKYPVTQEQWQAVTALNPSKFKGDGLPVESVSWEDCQEFCRRLNTWVSGDGFRLPTEAEWEYACRAGTAGPYNVDGAALDDLGWYGKNSGYKRHPVGQKRANAWGIHDMHGNVWEWCEDWYGGYSEGAATDPTGPYAGVHRVVRGGSWFGVARWCRSAYRDRCVPFGRDVNLGFRLALSSGLGS